MSIFKVWQDFAHSKEMRESKDEMLFGEIVKYMIENYGPLVELETKLGDKKIARFRTMKHKLLHSITVETNRHTGSGIVSDTIAGTRAGITVVAEVKNYVADPDDVLNMWKTDFQNIGKIPLLGGIKVDHQMNSILATKMDAFYRVGDIINDTLTERKIIGEKLEEMIALLCDQLKQYKK